MVQTYGVPAVRMKVAPRGLRDQVYELILDMLTETEIVPGSRLSIDKLADELGVSPTPVREALIEVEKTGLITREIHKGYRVAAPLSDGQLEALFDTRLVLEGGAVELAARRLDTLLPRLREALDTQRTLGSGIQASFTAGEPLSAHALRDYFRADWQFHRVIFEVTDNPFLLDMSEAISTRVHRMRQVAQTGVPDAPDAVVEHQAILDAFAQGPEQAVLAMRDHIERVRTRARDDSSATR